MLGAVGVDTSKLISKNLCGGAEGGGDDCLPTVAKLGANMCWATLQLPDDMEEEMEAEKFIRLRESNPINLASAIPMDLLML